MHGIKAQTSKPSTPENRPMNTHQHRTKQRMAELQRSRFSLNKPKTVTEVHPT